MGYVPWKKLQNILEPQNINSNATSQSDDFQALHVDKRNKYLELS